MYPKQSTPGNNKIITMKNNYSCYIGYFKRMRILRFSSFIRYRLFKHVYIYVPHGFIYLERILKVCSIKSFLYVNRIGVTYLDRT